MAIDLELLEAEALKLTAEQRARLAERLIALLGDSEIEAARATEVERRIVEIEVVA